MALMNILEVTLLPPILLSLVEKNSSNEPHPPNGGPKDSRGCTSSYYLHNLFITNEIHGKRVDKMEKSDLIHASSLSMKRVDDISSTSTPPQPP